MQLEKLTYLRRWQWLTVEMASNNSRVETKRTIFFFSAVPMMSFPVWNYFGGDAERERAARNVSAELIVCGALYQFSLTLFSRCRNS
jgi:hypothetical protein